MSASNYTYEVVEGWTANIDIDLKDDGATPAGTLAGTVEFILKDEDGNAVNFTGDVSIQDAANWRVRIAPDSTDFVTGVYRGRIKVTDSSSKIAYFPSARWDIWIIHPEA